MKTRTFDLTDILIITAFGLAFAGCGFRLWAAFFGPCSRPVMEVPGWCMLLLGGSR